MEPAVGNVTKTEKMSAYNAGAPTYVVAGTAAYDAHGRIIEGRDPLGNLTTTAYTPSLGGPVTGSVLTNPLGHVSTTTLDPAWGTSTTTTVDANGKRTDVRYDALGRLTGVWLPGRDVATQSANRVFGYTLRRDAVSSISAQKLNAAGGYVATYTLYDALLRPRQTQIASPSGGRILTNTFYDKLGRTAQIYGAYYATGAPGNTLFVPVEPFDVPNQTRTVYDGASRPITEIFQPYNVERWRTSIGYGGDRTDATPPQGATATSTLTDARGRSVELRQYHDPADVGQPNPALFDATTYVYNRKGQLVQVSDPAANQWAYTYDLRGRKITDVDPDRGTTTYGYDNADRLTSTIDARSLKLVYTYDALNRKTAVYQSIPFGTPRARWVYDTLAKGQLYQSVRFNGSDPYTVKVRGYTDAYQPTGHDIIIPAAETGLAGTYTYQYAYNVDASLAATALPAVADLDAETVRHAYDSLGLPTQLTATLGVANLSYVSDTAYNALGQIDQYTLYTGLYTQTGQRVHLAYGRELDTGRITQIYADTETAPYIGIDLRYTYDHAGNITKIGEVSGTPTDTQCFGYDYLRRLTEAWTPGSGDCATPATVAGLGGPAPYWHSWTHDQVGNRLTQTIHTAGGDTTSAYDYPDPGTAKPHTISGVSTTGPGGNTTSAYSYDPAGNTTSRPTTTATQTLTWDPEGHLATTTDPTGTTSYLYDADGNRLIRRDPTGKTLYLPNQELRHTTSSGATTCTRYYQHNATTVASRTSAGLTWLTADHQGTQMIAVNQSTQAVTQRRQTPYGQPRGTNPTWPNPKGYVGGDNDPTELTHLGAREYDPTIGRFISLDPVMDLAGKYSVNPSRGAAGVVGAGGWWLSARCG